MSWIYHLNLLISLNVSVKSRRNHHYCYVARFTFMSCTAVEWYVIINIEPMKEKCAREIKKHPCLLLEVI